MDRKQMVRLALGFSAVAIAMIAMPSVAFAQEAGRAAEHATFLTTLFIGMSVVFHHDDHHGGHDQGHGHHDPPALKDLEVGA